MLILSVCLAVCLSVRPSVLPSVCLLVCPTVGPTSHCLQGAVCHTACCQGNTFAAHSVLSFRDIVAFRRQTTGPPVVCLSVCLSIRSPVRLSIRLSVRLVVRPTFCPTSSGLQGAVFCQRNTFAARSILSFRDVGTCRRQTIRHLMCSAHSRCVAGRLLALRSAVPIHAL